MAWCVSPCFGIDAHHSPLQNPVIPGERLSAWVLRHAGATADTSALHWRVEAQRAPQARLRQAVLNELRSNTSISLTSDERESLSDWLLSFPLTGRVTLAIPDARWLQGSPAQDPILTDRQQVVLYARPSTVTVVTPSAKPCAVSHIPGAGVQDYLRACDIPSQGVADWAWIAQPDGRTRRFGIASWNQEPQDEAAPGAWIWSPPRSTNLPNSVSDNLARFLATQAPFEATHVVQAIAPPAPPSLPLKDAYRVTSSDWGDIGLLQTPTARMASAGDVRWQMSHVAPYTRGTVILTPLDWLAFGFRYTDVSNRLYGPVDFSGNQTYKDKSIDVKFRLNEETNAFPQIALGMRDIGGTGLFSGEYLVASKRWGHFDASLGLGWGYLGARGNIKNPLAALSASLKDRPVIQVEVPGAANTQAMFHGPVAVLGGLQWQADPWTVKLEQDGNDYQHEPQANQQVTNSPLNVGLVYRYSPHIDLSAALERGNSLMLGFTLHGELNQLHTPKLLDPTLPAVTAQIPAHLPPAGWGNTAKNIEIYTGWTVRSITHQFNTTTVQVETDAALYVQDRVDRAIRVLHRDAPVSSKRFVFLMQERGLPSAQIDIDRAEWVSSHLQAQAPALQLPSTVITPRINRTPAFNKDNENGNMYWHNTSSRFKAEVEPSYSQSLGGPDGFLLYQIGAQAKLEHHFSDTTWINGVLNYRLLDNYDLFSYDAPSELPRVRTYIRQYVTTSRLTMPLLQITHVHDLGNNHYASVYAGMLEYMYVGVGAEWLYRPWHANLAFGVDANHVRQRDFSQNFALRDYAVNTGHATLYWDTDWNDVQIKLSAGRYLAGDVGTTLDVKRVFNNGTSIGVWATKTNLSAKQFGEGSFDKGIYVNIPFDVMLPKSSPSTANIIWTPLTRDGGARLNRKFTLFDLTRQQSASTMDRHPATPVIVQSGQNTDDVMTPPKAGIFGGVSH